MNCAETLKKNKIVCGEDFLPKRDKYIMVLPNSSIEKKQHWGFRSGAKFSFDILQPLKTEVDFMSFASSWREQTTGITAISEKFLNENYLKIIGMGEKVLPYIFKDLQENGGHWFIALESITHENPVHENDFGNIPKMTNDWIDYALEHGYL